VVVVDYGIGNVFSVCQAIRQAGGSATLSGDRLVIARANRLILPGVGAFGRAVEELRNRRLDEPVAAFCETGRPFLGICVGMQVMLSRGLELGEHVGLSLIDGDVERIPSTTTKGGRLRVPNIGWSEVQRPEHVSEARWQASVLSEVSPGRSAVYFLHSFAARPHHAADILAEVEYGGHRLVAAIQRANLTGVQFHPERSGLHGQAVLRRFLDG
jgi:glutamine amidotransferase